MRLLVLLLGVWLAVNVHGHAGLDERRESLNAAYQLFTLETNDEDFSSKTFETRVAYGYPVEDREMPYTVYLQIVDIGGNVKQCGGSLISSNIVLSAAHCFVEDNGQSYVTLVDAFLNETNLKEQENLTRIPVETFLTPEDYFPNYFGDYLGDVALVKLSRPAMREPVQLAQKNETLPPFYVVAGWGATEYNISWSPQLKYTTVEPLSQDKASEYIALEEDHFAAGLGPDGNDACIGDSGGPLIIPSKEWYTVERNGKVRLRNSSKNASEAQLDASPERDILVGIVSYGINAKCGAREGNIGFYTNVSFWKEWIDGVTEIQNWRDDIIDPAKACFPETKTCFKGKGIKQQKFISPGNCCAACRNIEACAGWSWISMTGLCTLHAHKTWTRVPGDCTSGTWNESRPIL